jgi:hypothetical protein
VTSITGTIAALTGDEAIRVLARHRGLPEPAARPGRAARPGNRPARSHH